MTTLLIVAVAWTVLAIVTALVLGAVIRHSRPPHERDGED